MLDTDMPATRRKRGRILQDVIVSVLPQGELLKSATKEGLYRAIRERVTQLCGEDVTRFCDKDVEKALRYAHADGQIRCRHSIIRDEDGVYERQHSVLVLTA